MTRRITVTRLGMGVLISCLTFAAVRLIDLNAAPVPPPQSSESGPDLIGLAAIKAGRPVVLLDPTVELPYTVSRASYRGEEGLHFEATLVDLTNNGKMFPMGPYTNPCGGDLYIVTRGVSFVPNADYCGHDVPITFTKSEITNLKDQGDNISFTAGDEYDISAYKLPGEKGLTKQQKRELPPHLIAWISLALTDPSAAEQRFTAIVANAVVPLSEEQQAEITSQENAGDSVAQAGKLYDALHDYEAAFQELPTQWAPQDVENRLEKKTIKLVQCMNPKPAIPQDAMRHMAYAETAFQEAKGPADFDNAIQELNKALRLAPWWGAAYKNLGLLDEKANRDADAARNLQLYLLATPNAPDAQSVQMKIYSLQYKAKYEPDKSGGPEPIPALSVLHGVVVQDVAPSVQQRFGVSPGVHGVVVTQVAAGTPAAHAGLEAGDVIQSINRKSFADAVNFSELVAVLGKRGVLLLVNRQGKAEYVVVGAPRKEKR